MGELLRAGGRSAICAAALALSPFSPNFHSTEASDHVDKCVTEAGRLVLDVEDCVEKPIPKELGQNLMEDWRVWLVGGVVLTAIGVGLGAGLSTVYRRLGNLESDHTQESIEANLARQQKDKIEAEAASKARLDKIEAWLNARGEIPVSRYLLSTAGRGVKAVWRGFKAARKDAKDNRREDKQARNKNRINRNGGFLGQNTRT